MENSHVVSADGRFLSIQSLIVVADNNYYLHPKLEPELELEQEHKNVLAAINQTDALQISSS